MPEACDPYLYELTQHIVALADFWRRNNSNSKPDNGFRVISTLIETGLNVDAEPAEAIAQAVFKELDAAETASFGNEADATKIRCEIVSAILRDNAVRENNQPTLFEVSWYR